MPEPWFRPPCCRSRGVSPTLLAAALALLVVSTTTEAAPAAPPTLPLHTKGRYIVDDRGKVVNFHCVNWYGSHMEQMAANGLNVRAAADIASTIAGFGFNCIRLPYSLDVVLGNLSHVPTPQVALAANTDLMWRTPLEVFDATVEALTDQGLMVILNNHVSTGGWCCSGEDGEGFWYTKAYPEDVWLDHLGLMAKRYKSNPLVVGFDLRNEIRPYGMLTPTWGSGDPETDWAIAAVEGGKRVLAENPNMLIIVSGLFYSEFLCTVPARPIHMEAELKGHVVYTAHEYWWFNFHLVARHWIGTSFLMLVLWCLGLWIVLMLTTYVDARRCLEKTRMGRLVLRLLGPARPAEGTPVDGASCIRVCSVQMGVAVTLTILCAVLLLLEPTLLDRCSVTSLVTSIVCLALVLIFGLVALVLWMRIALACVRGRQLRELALAEAGSARSQELTSSFHDGRPLPTERGISLQQMGSEALSPTAKPASAEQLAAAKPPALRPHGDAFVSLEAGLPRVGETSASTSSSSLERERRRGLVAALVSPLCLTATVMFVLVASFSFIWHDFGSYETFAAELDGRWGFLLSPDKSSNMEAAPVWLNEFGTGGEDIWWNYLMRYIQEREVGWAYWAVNGQKTNNASEHFGLLMEDSLTVRHAWKMESLQELMNVSQPAAKLARARQGNARAGVFRAAAAIPPET